MVNEVFVTTTVNKDLEILSPMDQLVQQFNSFAAKSAENFLKLAGTLVRAEDELSKRDLSLFGEKVWIKQGGPKYRKLLIIGKKISRLEPYLKSLPNNWTTLYKLASVDAQEFKLVADSGRLNTATTAEEVKLILNDQPKVKKPRVEADCIIDLNGLENGQKLNVYRQLEELQKQFRFELKLGDTLKAIAKAAEEASPGLFQMEQPEAA